MWVRSPQGLNIFRDLITAECSNQLSTEDAVGVAVAVPDEVLVPGRFVEDHVRVTELVAVETRT